jgi:hypothetical protein
MCKNIEFVQIVCRVAQLDSQAPYAKLWWPNVQASMLFMNPVMNRAQVIRYVLHARHGKPEEPRMTL